MAYYNIAPNGTMTEVKSLTPFVTVDDAIKETLFADTLQQRYGFGIPAKFTRDGNLLVAANQQEAIAASNVFSQGFFGANANLVPNASGAFNDATKVVQLRQPTLRPSIMGSMRLAA